MANYLKYDVYDLELTDVHANSELRELDDRQANEGQTVNIIQEDEPKVSFSIPQLKLVA